MAVCFDFLEKFIFKDGERGGEGEGGEGGEICTVLVLG